MIQSSKKGGRLRLPAGRSTDLYQILQHCIHRTPRSLEPLGTSAWC